MYSVEVATIFGFKEFENHGCISEPSVFWAFGNHGCVSQPGIWFHF
jgi:hypothetical protein